MGRWGDGEMGRWGDGEGRGNGINRWKLYKLYGYSPFFISDVPSSMPYALCPVIRFRNFCQSNCVERN
ncbi:MAG: hypothetical protein KME17_12575 [Cyanosarcina radialis HA8281-LM2]|nr:hypothetical protein [Cyanosarcina radialis HA8281-LM2]